MAEPARRLLRRLRVPGGPAGLESGGGGVDLGDGRIRGSLEISREALAHAAERRPEAGADPDLIDRLLADADRGFAKLAEKGGAARLRRDELYALEAVIETDGTRPVLFVENDSIDPAAPELANWGAAAGFRSQIEGVIRSVGRVEAAHIEIGKGGTMFVIAPGLAVTNRHVLEGLCSWNGSAWTYFNDAFVDFAGEHGSAATRRFKLGEVVFTGPDAINWQIDFTRLDLAVFRLVPGNEPFPAPLSFEKNPDRYLRSVGGGPRHIYTVGFPGEPMVAPAPPAGVTGARPAAGHEYREVIDSLFHATFGVKRWAPGEIEAAPGELADDPKKWVFSHDASTLAGSSGSCVVDLRDNGQRVLGIHFGGRARQVNWAHGFAALRPHLQALDKMVWL